MNVSPLAEEFARWAVDPSRTNEELYTTELILEWARVVWGREHQKPQHLDWPARRARTAERKGNPAYRAKLDLERLAMAVEVWEKIDKLPATYDDRPVRDLSPLRFFPHFQEITVTDAELADLGVLAELQELRTLSLTEPVLTGGYVTDHFAPLAGLPMLENVTLNLRLPWPDVRALGTLPALRNLMWVGNLLALRTIQALPEVRVAMLSADFYWKTPLPDLREFPAMPKVERAKIDGVDDLAGLERYPNLRNLDLIGPFRDLTPLATLSHLTWLRLEGGCFDDLTPLARLPQLREVVLVRERPLDLSPLTEAPSLHEIKVERCTILNTELAALNAGLIPWEQDFLLLQPRPLAPLRFIRYDPQHEELKALYPIWNALPDPRTQFYGEDVAYADAEGRWFGQETIRRLTALLGPGWQGEFCDVNTGGGNLCFARYRDLLRMREILQTLRELMAAVRLPTSFMLNFEPHGDMSVDLAQIEDRRQLPAEGPWLVQEFDPVREKENRESFNEERRKRFELMEREHRLRLLEQQGAKIDPAEFSPGGEPPLENVAAGPTEPAEDESDDDDGGGVATPPPPPDGESELAAKLRFLVTLHEDVLWSTGGKMGENAAYAYGEKPEDWHALPEPPEKRPRPR